LTNTSIPATSKFNGTPNAAMILKALKQLSGNGNMQLNQLDVKNIVLVPDQSGIGTGSADVVPTAHSVVYNENTTLNPDEVSVSFSYISEPVDLNTIITTKNLGNFDEAPTVADLFGRMFSLNTTADIMFNPSDLTLTITSSGSATVIANDAAHFYGTVNLA
jgi:hypothetical protein